MAKKWLKSCFELGDYAMNNVWTKGAQTNEAVVEVLLNAGADHSISERVSMIHLIF